MQRLPYKEREPFLHLRYGRLDVRDNAVVREMYRRRFNEESPDRRSVEQLRGIEGVRVREEYQRLAERYGVRWTGRNYDTTKWTAGDEINRAISAANACLYGVSEACILVAGYSPAVGFLHSGRPLSFVYDVADLYKFELSVPVAFEVVAEKKHRDVEGVVRRRLRDAFKEQRVMAKIIPDIEDILAVGADRCG